MGLKTTTFTQLKTYSLKPQSAYTDQKHVLGVFEREGSDRIHKYDFQNDWHMERIIKLNEEFTTLNKLSQSTSETVVRRMNSIGTNIELNEELNLLDR